MLIGIDRALNVGNRKSLKDVVVQPTHGLVETSDEVKKEIQEADYLPEKRFLKPPQWLKTEDKESALSLEDSIVDSLSHVDDEDGSKPEEKKESSDRRSHISRDKTENTISTYGKYPAESEEKSSRSENAKQKQFKSLNK